MEMTHIINWLHLTAIVFWIGGTAFQMLVLLPVSSKEAHGFPSLQFTEAAVRFRGVVWLAIALSLISGILRVQAMGGMASVPPIIHTKILIATIMYGLGLLNSLVLTPRLHLGVATIELLKDEEKAQLKRTMTGFVACQSLIVMLGLGILMMLSLAGLI
jgi:uncharacterized membrane protein